jgi:hypothetical protein
MVAPWDCMRIWVCRVVDSGIWGLGVVFKVLMKFFISFGDFCRYWVGKNFFGQAGFDRG